MIENFHTLWLKFNESCSDKHQIFLREHSVRNQEVKYPRGRTLFVLNIPPYANEISLKDAFSKNCGDIELVELKPSYNPDNNGFKIGYIVFSSESSLDAALSLQKDYTLILNDTEQLCIVGIEKWCKEYNDSIESEETIRRNVEDYMKNYDEKIQEESIIEDNKNEEDGWITVNSKKKRGKFAPARKESTIEKIEKTEKEKNKKKQLLNFYTFQIRESKKQHLAELRKKFELDKKKLQQLKAKRLFKPFG